MLGVTFQLSFRNNTQSGTCAMGILRAFTGVAAFQCLYLYWLLSCTATTGARANRLYYESTTCSGRLFRENSHQSPDPDGQCSVRHNGRYSNFESIPDGQPFDAAWTTTPHATRDVFVYDTECAAAKYWYTAKYESGRSHPDGSSDTERVDCDCAARRVTVSVNGVETGVYTIGKCELFGIHSVRWTSCGNCSVSPASGDSDSAAAASFLRVETLKQALALSFFVYGVLFI